MPLLDRIGKLPAYRDLLARLEAGTETVTTARGLGLAARRKAAAGGPAAG